MATMVSLDMTSQRQTDKILDLERGVLRAICSDFTTSSGTHGKRTKNPLAEALRDAVGQLADYTWQSTEHAVVFRAIAKLQATGNANVAEQLPAQVTRMGFPDVDWRLYLRPSGTPRVEIAELVRILKTAATNKRLTPE